MKPQTDNTTTKTEACRWCAQGDKPKFLDADGTLVSITGNEGILSHAYDDSWWPCLKFGVEMRCTRISAASAAPTVDEDLVMPETAFLINEPSVIDCAVCGGRFPLPETVIAKNAGGKPERTCVACSKGKPIVDSDLWPEQLTIIRYDDGGFSATQAIPPHKAKFARVYYRDAAASLAAPACENGLPQNIKVVIRAGGEDWIGVAYCKDYAGDPSTIHEYYAAPVGSENEADPCAIAGRHVCGPLDKVAAKAAKAAANDAAAKPSGASWKVAVEIANDRLGPRSDSPQFWDKYAAYVKGVVEHHFSATAESVGPELERLRKWQADIEEREAAVCPEDVPFDEYIRYLESKLEGKGANA